jgi:hypothetical protein
MAVRQIKCLIPILLLLAGCGSSSPTPTPTPTPSPTPVPFAGAIDPSSFQVTQSNVNGAAATGTGAYVNNGGTFTFPLCPDVGGVQSCWISYVEHLFSPTASILGRTSVTMTYTLTVSPDVVWDCNSPGNQPNCNNTPYVRILLHHVGDNFSLSLPDGFYRWFSQYTNMVPGTNTVTYQFTPDYFAPPVKGAVQSDLNNTLSNLGGIGFCFGGGDQHDFDCHGLDLSAGSATFTVAVVQARQRDAGFLRLERRQNPREFFRLGAKPG